ncbi:unnamed protein product, partial [Adineta steineri]
MADLADRPLFGETRSR